MSELQGVSPVSEIKTICPYCGTGCSMTLRVADGRIAHVTPDPAHPVNRGELCLKGYYGYAHVADRQRLITPLRREGERFTPISWNAALDEIAGRLTKIKGESGPDAFALFSSARATNEENYAAQKFARAVIGTNNVDHCARLCHSSSTAGLEMTLGSGAMTISVPEIGAVSDLIFIIGSNTAECHPLIARQVILAQERGAKLIVADPRRTDMADKADLWIRTPLGYNIPLVNAMTHVIIKEGLHKPDFIAAHSVGFEEVARAVEGYTPEAIEKMSGMPAAEIVAFAGMYARAKAAAILWAMGVTQHTHGVANVVALANLAVITGQIGRPGAGVCPLRGQNNVQGAGDMGALPNAYPGARPVTDPQWRAHYEAAWGTNLSDQIGLRVTEVPRAINEGKLRALVVFGENPLMSDPDSSKLREEVQKLDLVAVFDMFMSETARFAHFVLPAAGWPEKDGTFTNTERRVQRVRAAVPPPGEARPDWTVFRDLAARMGYGGMNYTSAEEIWEEIRRVEPATIGGISYARLDREHGILWPCPTEDHPGTPVLHRDGVFLTPSAKAQLRPVLFDPDDVPDGKALGFDTALCGHVYEHASAEYPLVMTTGRRVMHYHTGTMTRKSPLLEQLAPEPQIEINPADAAALSVRQGDFIRVETRRGSIIARAWVTERVAPGNLFSTFHYWEACCNELTSASALDPICRIPAYKVSAARVIKSTPAEARAWISRIGSEYRLSVEQAGVGTAGAQVAGVNS